MKIAEELRPDGSTRFKVQHRDPERPGKYTTKRFDDKRDAAEFVRRAKVELADALAWETERRGGASFRGQSGRTFADYAADYIRAQTDAKQESRDKQESRLRTIKRVPSFAQLPIGAVTTTDIERFKRELSELPNLQGEGLLKSRTKNLVLEVVFSVLRRAAELGDIPKDVTLGVKRYLVDDAKTPCPISVAEFDSVLIHVQPSRRPLFRFLLDSGLRISEALALEWDDLTETAHGIYEVSVWGENAADGKTGHAQRITTIPAETFKLIERDETSDAVFPLTYHTVSNEWRRAVQRAQTAMFATEFPPLMKSPTIHDLRHSHASYLLTKCGFNLALVAERLGHKDISVTQRYYGRLVKDQTHELGVLIARNIPRGVVS